MRIRWSQDRTALTKFACSARQKNGEEEIKKTGDGQTNAVDTLVALWPCWWQPHECFHLFKTEEATASAGHGGEIYIYKKKTHMSTRAPASPVAPPLRDWPRRPPGWHRAHLQLGTLTREVFFRLRRTAETLGDYSRAPSRWLPSAKWRNNTGATMQLSSYGPRRGVFGLHATSFLQCGRSLKQALFLIRLCVPPPHPDSLFAVQKQMVRVCAWLCKHRTFPYNPSPSSVWPALWAGLFFLLM